MESDEDSDLLLPSQFTQQSLSKTQITLEDLSSDPEPQLPARSPALPPGRPRDAKPLQRRAFSTSNQRILPKALNRTQIESENQNLNEKIFAQRAPRSAVQPKVAKLARPLIRGEFKAQRDILEQNVQIPVNSPIALINSHNFDDIEVKPAVSASYFHKSPLRGKVQEVGVEAQEIAVQPSILKKSAVKEGGGKRVQISFQGGPKQTQKQKLFSGKEIDDLILNLDIKKDWKVQHDTLLSFQSVADNQFELFLPNLDAIMNQMHQLLQAQRSAVFKEAIITLAGIYDNFRVQGNNQLTSSIEVSMFNVLLKAGSAAQQDFLAESADNCLRNINLYIKFLISQSKFPKAITNVLNMLNRLLIDKSPGVRSRSAFLASDILEYSLESIQDGNDFTKAIFRSVSSIMMQTLSKICQDSNPECRKGGRRLYFYLKGMCSQSGVALGLQQYKSVEDIIYREGVSAMWWDLKDVAMSK